ncbi:NAD(P)-binding protein [Fictibacillus terranigra]|uniref:precorrin-2 dehydrogenase n=1 Tax=Fictibacillus terranigra TaxID=3058424 RepID=A0ABT8E870_9BACL|nr:NAD(P)-binding protein [Fictibacillus sp. CENA-BCM004]MDN4074121.1 NAD(P)-binding protein [Fictibacillus sp. CENA-BCM004]
MSHYYPIMLNIQGKKAIVVGGGTIAERKIRGLLEADADITVISPVATEQISRWAADQQIQWKQKNVEPSDTDGAFLVITAVNEPAVNQKVQDSADPEQLLCRSDDQTKGNFILPSLFRQGKLTVAVSTSGASPGLAKRITKELSSSYDESFGEYLEFLDRCRIHVKSVIREPERRKSILTQILDQEFQDMSGQEREQRFLALCSEGGREDE